MASLAPVRSSRVCESSHLHGPGSGLRAKQLSGYRQRQLRVRASAFDELPRIVQDIPRRIRGGDGSLLSAGGQQLSEALGFLNSLVSRLISPDASSLEASQRTDVRLWPFIVGGALTIALCLEIYTAGVLLRDFVLRTGKQQGAQRGRLPPEWQLPDTAEVKQALKQERGRGINWLLVAVAFAVWVSGVFDSATPLRP